MQSKFAKFCEMYNQPRGQRTWNSACVFFFLGLCHFTVVLRLSSFLIVRFVSFLVMEAPETNDELGAPIMESLNNL
ncbi:hypothetical protein ACLKA6_019863 [Drosophila palustris]